MYVTPINPNVIQISTVMTGCCKSQYDSTYPVRLNGIISPAEFEESINNINQAKASRTPFLIMTLVSAILLLGGIALIVAGAATAVTSGFSAFPILVGVGVGIFFLGMIISSFGCCCIQLRSFKRLKQAIAIESDKYSTRSKPCSWRLNSSTQWTGTHNHRQQVTKYHLVIDIGNAGANGMYQAPPPPSAFGRPQAGAFCSACGAPRQVSAGKFCSSCGQPFNN